jgi:hypothetical protein
MRNWQVAIVLTVLTLATHNSARAQAIGNTAVTPDATQAGVPLRATVTTSITDPALIPESVNLQKIDASGRVLAILGTLHDDGLNFDAVAGDQIYSLSTTIFENTPSALRVRVSAAFRGSLLRVYSAPLTINVTGTATGITIASPSNTAYLNISPITVSGTTGDPAAHVTINGVNAPVSGGSFLATVPLNEGPNTLTAVATNSNGTTSTTSTLVTLDTTPPHVAIYSPTSNTVTTDATTTVTGLVNDIVVGTVNPQQATVTVNGIVAQVINRTFTANIPLTLGANSIQVTGVDRAGNGATATLTVTRQALTQTTLRVSGGNGQAGPIGALLPTPLAAQLLSGAGQPIPNTPVVFRVTSQDGTLSLDGNAGTGTGSIAVNTDVQGIAAVKLTVGSRAGAGNNIVEASTTGVASTAVFNASATPATPGLIIVDTGNSQSGVIGQPLALPFIAVVTDAGYNRLAGARVTFTVKQGDGSFAGQPTLEATSDSDGRVLATLTLGPEPGVSNNVVEASFAGNSGAPVAFTASALAPGPANATRISGVVLDNSNNPIPGVTMRLFQINQANNGNIPQQVATSALTDAQGQFVIQPAPVGIFKLMADGGTAQRPGSWPTLEYDIVTVSGQDNNVGLPIYLPELLANNRLCVSPTTGGTLTIPQAPGFSLTIAPGSATFPGGSRTGCVSVTPVNMDKVPMAPGFGQQPRFVVTIQPVGTTFNQPAAITIPNVDGLAPRAVTEMYSYDHDLAAFVAIGTGTVSDDGSVIRSDPGVGVLKAGWHCGGNPTQTGSAGTCPDCKKCQGSKCEAAPSLDGSACSTVNVAKGICKGGTCTPSDGRLKIDQPAANTKLEITSAPQMPDLTAHARILDLDPDPTSSTEFNWKAQIRYTGQNGRKLDVNIPDSGTTAAVGGNYTADIGGITRGGNLTFSSSASINGKTLSDSTKGLIIRGVNPSHQQVNARLGGFPATSIACWESLHKLAQFDSQGLPLFGGPNGYGVMQVDNPPVSDEGIWNWKQNVDEGLAIIAQKRRDAEGYPGRVKRNFPDATDFVALNLIDQDTGQPYVVLETIQRYNGGAYWVWNDVTKAWVKSPPNQYVKNVLESTCP